MNAKIKKFGFPLPIAGASGGSKSPSVPREDPDNLQSSAYVNIIDLIGEGQIGGLVDNVDGDSLTEKEKSIFFDGTRLRHTNGELNFANVSWAERVGLQRQDYIEGFGEGVETPFYKNVQLKSGIPSAFTVSNPNADRVRIILAVNSLLSTDRSSGDTYGTSVEFQIKLSVNNGPYEILANKKITGKTTSRYQRSFSFDLPKKKADGTPITAWSFQITRTTPDSNSSYLQNTTFFESYSEVELTKFSYPNVALVATRFSSETFSSIPKREYLVDGLLIKVPSNRNKDGSYTGPWDGTFKLESSSNPAWILYDLLLSKRYGLGEYITPEMIDESRLYVIGQYCDQLVDDGFGNKEPRYTINCVINTRVEAYDLIVDICSAFNGMAYWAGHMVGFTIDAPGTPQMLFNNTNIVGDFSYQGTSNKDRHSVAVVTWNDPNDDYKQVPEVVEDPELIERYGIRKTEVMAFGCTSRGQAARYGRWLLYSEHQQSETITFNVGIDAALLLPGDLIYVQDRDRAGKRFGGRLLDCTAKQAVLDDLVDFGEFTDLTLVIRLEDGSLAERVIASHTKKTVTVSGHTKEVTVVEWAEALTVMPVKYALWIIKAAELQPVIARVVNVAQGEEKGTYNITAVPHNPNKYQSIENDLMLDVPPTSILNSRNQEPPASVEIKSEIITTQNVAKTRLVISWKEAKNAARYEVEWKRNDGNWVKLPQTTSLSIEVEDVYAGAYTARVVAYNLFGARSYPKYSTSTDVKGKVGKPTNVLSLTTTPLLFGMKLDWVYPAGNSDLSHVVIEVSDRADGSNPRLLGNVSYPTNTLTIQGLQGGLDQWYRTKTVDKSGNESDWSTFVKGTTGNDPDLVLDLISGQIDESDLAQELQGKIENSANVAEAAQTAANNAKAAADNAQTAATDAQTAAVNAQTSANDASVIATNAKNTANNASTAASKVASDLITSTNLLNQKIADESSTRIAAISNLNDGLTTETTQRKSEDAALLSNIETYKSSTNGTLSSLQTQITTNATNTSANAMQINALDSRLTTNESKTNTAISSAATAQTTANTAVSKADAASMSINTLKSTLRVQADALNIDPHFVSGLEYYTIAETPAGNSVTHGAYGENGSLGIRVIKSNTDTSAGTNTNVNTNRTDGFFLKANNTYRAIVRCKLISGTGSILGRFHRKSDNAVLASATLSVTSTSAYVDLIYTYKPTSDVLVYFGTWVMASGTIDYDSISIINATDAVASDANASAITNLASRVTNAEGTLTSQGSSITQLNNNIVSINGTLASKADASTLSSLANRVTTTEGNISSQGGAITSLQNNVSTINNALASKADSIALSALDSRVTTTEGTITSQGASIASLQNSLSSVGVNLVALADQLKTVSMAATTGESYITWSLTDPALKPDTYYTLSFWAVRTANVKSVESFLIASNGAHHKSTYVTVGTTNLVRYSVTFKTNADAVGVTYSLRFDLNGSSDGNNATLTIQKPQLEEGQVATYWKPSTYDKADASALSTLQNTVTQQGNTLTSNSSAITSLQNSVTNINNALTSKADASAVSSIDSKVTTIDGKVTSNTANITSLNNSITNGSLNLVYNTLYNDLSNITANGNHSIAVDSATYARSRVLKVTASGAGQDGVHQILMTTSVVPVASSNEPLVLSFFAKADAALSVKIQLFGGIGSQNIALTTTWTKYTITTLRKSASHVDTTNLYMSLLAAGVAYFTNVQLERGTIATSYSAASTETGNLIAANASALSSLSSTVTQHGNALTSQGNSITSLSNSLVTTNNNVATAQNTADNAAAAAAAAQNTANTKADASALNSLANTVSSQGGTISSQGNAITSLTNTLNNLSVGSTNLLSGTDLSTHPSKDGTFKNGNMISATATTAGSVDMLAIKSTVELLAGEYVVSFWAKAETAGTLFNVYFYNPNTTTSGTASNGATTTRADGQVVFALTTTMTKYFVKYKQAGNTSKKDVLFRIQPPASGTNKVWLALPKLEEGNVVTDWSPSINDVASSAALNSLGSTVTQQGNTLTSQGNAITSLNNSVNTLNNALATKADSSAIVALDSRVTATENSLATTNSSITSLQSAIQSQGDALNLDPNFREGLKFIAVSELTTGNSIVAGNYGESGGTGLRVTKSNDAGTAGTNPSVRTPTSGMWLKAGRTYQATVRVRKVSGTTGLLLRWVRASDNAAVAVRQVTATDTTNFVDFSLDYAPTSDVFAWFGVWMYPNAGVVDYSSIRLVDKTASLENAATASAVSSLTSRVASAEGTITSQGNSIVSLNNSVSNINGALATKADNAALSSLDSRVTATENSITSQGNQITSLQAGLSAAAVIGANLLSNTAAPNSANQPKTSDGTASAQGFSTNFNIDSYFTVNDASVERYYRMTSPVNATSVLRASTTYTISADVRGAALPVRWRIIAQVAGAWSDIAVKSMSGISNNQYTRQSCTFTVPANATSLIMSFQSDSTTVGNALAIRRMKLEQGNVATLWEQPIGEIATSKALSSLDTRVTNAEGTISSQSNSITQLNNSVSNINGVLASKADASALSSLDSKVSVIDGKVSTQASSITTLQTTVGGNTASIQSQQQSIDGLKSRATLKLQSGNLIGGVGIENDSKTVDFIIQANKFAIAPPSDAAAGSVAPKYAFVYQPTATTLPNGTVVPAGLYLDNASIGYINAEKINASSLSALSANLGTLTTLKDPTKPNGARMVMTGSLTTVYDDNNVARIRLGIW
ncbi:phage tail protein [Acinetobacter baumannii]|uniref:TipJ family phage tail tip protein n=1 Tax=Acinetobacter baumannii TaxID=470 RepID=UPI000DE7B602|nr:phage tail protein [Acinetobacter baumannii]MDA3585648.1 phage tail protein [Acinetobacter baumannii]MDI9740145.1 phage tail protein [Acinetobacter baumannii]QLY88260.1 host specificity protein J [Acinetobacter baumannii]SSQ62385.1 Phage-related protein, tail component [Acinetobacter baumannii]HDK9102472.1 host specificity protein J [Acinetobacter baumannii]